MYQVIRRLPLPAGPLGQWPPDPGRTAMERPAEFSTLAPAVRHFLKLANDGVRGLSILGPDDREVIDLSEWAPLVFINQRSSLMAEIEALEDGRMRSHDRTAAIADRRRRIAELDVFLVQAQQIVLVGTKPF